MNQDNVQVGPAFSYGWSELKKNFWYFIGLAVIMIILGSIGSGWREHRTYFNLVGFLINAWLTCGLVRILLDYYDGKKRELTDIFTQVQYFWRILLVNLFVGIIVCVGFILFIIPGIYLALRFQFVGYLVIDKNLAIGEAMKRSTELTRGIKGSLFLFALAMIGSIILGAICLGVGIFVAMPVVWLAHIYLYRKLTTAAPMVAPAMPK